MNRPQRNHNPGNLRFAHQHEATGQDVDGYAVFPNDPAGFRALHAQLRLFQLRDLTLEQALRTYAPPKDVKTGDENNTLAYIGWVANQLMVHESIKLSILSVFALAGVMAQYEGYYKK